MQQKRSSLAYTRSPQVSGPQLHSSFLVCVNLQAAFRSEALLSSMCPAGSKSAAATKRVGSSARSVLPPRYAYCQLPSLLDIDIPGKAAHFTHLFAESAGLPLASNNHQTQRSMVRLVLDEECECSLPGCELSSYIHHLLLQTSSDYSGRSGDRAGSTRPSRRHHSPSQSTHQVFIIRSRSSTDCAERQVRTRCGICMHLHAMLF